MTKETTTTIKLTYLRYFSTKTNQKTPAKRYNFVNGEVVKERMSMDACYRGETISITTAQELLDIYQNMDPADALTYGVSAKGHSEYVCVPVYRKEDIEEQIQQSKDINLPVISRTRSDFEYAKEPGILFIDMDGIVGNFEDDIDKIYDAIPELKAYPHVVSRSGSSYIQLPDGTAHSQVKGIHIVWMVENASNIPKYGKILFDRLTLKGYSQIELSKTGAMLKRSVVDAMVWQPERFDFAGGAVLEGGLTYKERMPVLRGLRDDGKQLVPDSVFKPLSAKETKQVKDIWEDYKKEIRPESEVVEYHYIDEAKTPEERRARETYIWSRRAGNEMLIQSGFSLQKNDGEAFLIDDIFKDMDKDFIEARKKWHGLGLCDPDTLESGKAMLYVNNDKTVKVHSFKHGGKRYCVIKCPIIQESLNLVENAKAVNEILLRSGQFFRLGDKSFVQVVNGGLEYYSMEEDDIRKFIQNVSGVFFEWYNLKGQCVALPMNVARQFIAAAIGEFDEIEKVSRIPGLDLDLNEYGRQAGYHEKSRTYFLNDYSDFSQIDTSEDAQKAVERLLSPFSEYNFADGEKGKAVMLAAVLTSIFRPMLETAPGVAITTPQGGQSTGKAPMALAIAKAGGWGFNSRSWKDRNENDKAIHSHLAGQNANALYFDNVTGLFNSDVLAVVLTSSVYAARELGKTKDLPVSTAVLMMTSGNAYEP